MDTEFIWTMDDIATSFLVIPNILALIALSTLFFKLFEDFRERVKNEILDN